MSDHKHPTWYFGPGGSQRVFSPGETVPAGWHDHPSKAEAGKLDAAPIKPLSPLNPGGKVHDVVATVPAAPVVPVAGAATTASTGSASSEAVTDTDVDAHGWSFDPAMHASTRTKTKAGLWRMKVGVKVPDAKPGYPKAALDL